MDRVASGNLTEISCEELSVSLCEDLFTLRHQNVPVAAKITFPQQSTLLMRLLKDASVYLEFRIAGVTVVEVSGSVDPSDLVPTVRILLHLLPLHHHHPLFPSIALLLGQKQMREHICGSQSLSTSDGQLRLDKFYDLLLPPIQHSPTNTESAHSAERALNLLQQPSGLSVDLLPFQMRTVSWMLAREGACVASEDVGPLVMLNSPFKIDCATGRIHGLNVGAHSDPPPSSRGGICAEEMGLGKVGGGSRNLMFVDCGGDCVDSVTSASRESRARRHGAK